MHIIMPPSDTERNVQAIKYAIERKVKEVEQAGRKLDDLRAELRGLQAALEAIGGGPKSGPSDYNPAQFEN